MKIQDKVEESHRFQDGEALYDESESMEATPEEQEDYDMLTIRGRKMIFGPAKESLLTMMGASETPAKGLGEAAAMIIKSLVSSAKESGRELSPDAALEAGIDIVEDLNELAKANKVYTYDTPKDEQQEVGDALLWGVKYYGDGMVQSGEITPEMQQAAQQAMQEAMAEEQPQQTPVAAGVNQAMGGGMVGNMMGGA